MSLNNNFMFFDIDGVLMNPLGYRQATRDTITRIFSEFGMSNIKILESNLSAFEAQGITSEWDMIPLFLLAWMEKCFDLFTPLNKITDRNDLAIYLLSIDHSNFQPTEIINNLGKKLRSGMAPAESILENINNGDDCNKFPLVQNYASWLIQGLLTSTRDIKISNSTRIFQNLILGDRVFKEICGLSPQIKTDSYLIKYDEKFLNEKSLTMLQNLARLKSVYICAITARPSLQPSFEISKPSSNFYFPEAELAIKKLGFENLHVVGYGTVKSIAERININAESLVKPSFIHSLIALAVSCETNFEKILEFLKINRNGLEDPDQTFIGLESILPAWVFSNKSLLHVFEDSPIGVQSVKSLNRLLVKNGIDSNILAYGIASDSQKINSLKKENARIFANINQALSNYFETRMI